MKANSKSCKMQTIKFKIKISMTKGFHLQNRILAVIWHLTLSEDDRLQTQE